jgi:hypothetical protein
VAGPAPRAFGECCGQCAPTGHGLGMVPSGAACKGPSKHQVRVIGAPAGQWGPVNAAIMLPAPLRHSSCCPLPARGPPAHAGGFCARSQTMRALLALALFGACVAPIVAQGKLPRTCTGSSKGWEVPRRADSCAARAANMQQEQQTACMV